MEISTRELRKQPGKILAQVNKGLDVTITYRGKPSAKIIPIHKLETSIDKNDDELFGIWKDRKDQNDVELYIRKMRKGRKLLFKP